MIANKKKKAYLQNFSVTLDTFAVWLVGKVRKTQLSPE